MWQTVDFVELKSASAFSESVFAVSVHWEFGSFWSKGEIGVFALRPRRVVVSWKRWVGLGLLGRMWHCQVGVRLWCGVIGDVA